MDLSAKKIIVPSILLTVIALGLSFTWRNSYFKPYVIGIVCVPSQAFHEYISAVLVKRIKSDNRFDFRFITSPSTSDLIAVNAACNEALDSDVDSVICIGIRCAKGMVQTSRKRLSKKPVIFLGVLDAVKYELVESMERPGGHITGIESNHPTDSSFNMADLLLAIKPRAVNILFPYSMLAGGHESKAPIIKEACARIGIHVTLLPIYNLNETLSQVAGLLPHHDTLMYLEADGVAIYGPGLGKLASQHNVTMFAGSIDGIKDSALSYAADPACLADNAFEITKDILINKKNPGDIPVQQATVARNLIINTRLCKEQDLADIDIQKTINTIHHDERFALVRNHIIVN